MPYYVYKIHPPKRLEYMDAFDAYREAKLFTRARRKELGSEDTCTVRMIFAPSKEQAERLLQEVREAGHPLLTKPVAPARLRSTLVRLGRRPRGTD